MADPLASVYNEALPAGRPNLYHSAEMKNLLAALIKAQAEFTAVPKNKTASVYSSKTGKSYTYKYADLADVLTMALPVLTKHELGIIQPNLLVNGQLRVVTHLIHSSGEWMCGDGLALIESGPRQDVGTDLTYDRRYDLCGLLGIVADEDIDAQKDMPAAPSESVKQPTPLRPLKAKQVSPPAGSTKSANTANAPAEQLLNRREEIIAKLKAIEPNSRVLGQRAKLMFPQHETTRTLTVVDLEHLLNTLQTEKAPAQTVLLPAATGEEKPLDIPPDVAEMFDEGQVTTARKIQGATIGKGLAQRLHKLIGINKIHTEEELRTDYLEPLGLEHASDFPRDLYDSLCAWAEGKSETTTCIVDEETQI
jgi:hypothetical protein